MSEVKRVFVITSFGDRRGKVIRLIENIREFSKLPIVIYGDKHYAYTTDNEVWWNVISKIVDRVGEEKSKRLGVRSSNYYSFLAVLEERSFNSFCVLDDDMMIVNKNFLAGFDIAEKFGLALPMNPRIYVGYNALGTDMTDIDRDRLKHHKVPQYGTAVNFSPMFVCEKVDKVKEFLCRAVYQLKEHTCRGTIAIWEAFWFVGLCPFILPETFCVCGDYSEHWKNYMVMGEKLELMCLHIGHPEVKEVFELS